MSASEKRSRPNRHTRFWSVGEFGELQLSPRSTDRSLVDTAHILLLGWGARKLVAPPHRLIACGCYASDSGCLVEG
jgi:hypothetical protein